MSTASERPSYSISLLSTPSNSTDSNLHSLAALELLACENDGHRCYIEPPRIRVSVERRIARTARLLSRELSSPHTTVYQARLDDVERTLVGVCIWTRETEVTMEELMSGVVDDAEDAGSSVEEEEEDTEGIDEGFCWRYYAGSEARRREAMNERGNWWYLKQLFVHPDHLRRGIGSVLVTEGLRRADEGGLTCVLEATAGAVRLYEKLGFVEKYTCEVELTREGEGVLVRPGMIREETSTRDGRS